ncbi:hypothetical protein [Rubrimonas cliftonensis]|uniref:DUF4177 domain-containing protein n=1 Tax=Rubrimonas cliftonensis TaxID=89524 RepID=A0A1H4A332_9RHOB|nr:hypothetical protein [Rubrimonas cliftonensis]SEA29932.1 hypothetical protein SAMN05444370_10429 [Rubrimonas cliftonensis]
MSEWIYACAPAPRRPKRQRGHKTPCDALAAAMEAAITERAALGWEYVRTDLVPMESRASLFGGLVETHQGVMVFRKRAAAAPAARLPAAPAAPGPRESGPLDPVAPEIPRLGAARAE